MDLTIDGSESPASVDRAFTPGEGIDRTVSAARVPEESSPTTPGIERGNIVQSRVSADGTE